ncbi:5-hydroxytryptamine receptor-like isoform X2 [Anopheles albimanus]|uniref:5-hydroxytryptamine receptor-like isoform X2 n=1 Tax=Anopheles albimanus TaxID=7167 RepID=UPI00163FBF0A|nr:5-hydroxytryptamine receptor-like isoform X2 [Anopheles albimanus]
MALTDGRHPTNESFAWTALPWSRSTSSPTSAASRVAYGLPITSPADSSSTSSTGSTGRSALTVPYNLGDQSTAFTSTSPVRSSLRSVTSSYYPAGGTTPSVDRADLLYSESIPATVTTTVTNRPLSAFASETTPGTDETELPSFATSASDTVQNLTQTFLSNYSSTIATDYGGSREDTGGDGGGVLANSSPAGSGLTAGGISGGLSLSLPDLLEEDELMALWNCTNCFLLNYGASGGGNNTTSRYYFPNGTGTGRDLLLPGGDLDEDAIASETTIYLIRVIATAIVLGIVILATVIGNVFVIAAILLERNLQSVANHLILSLAVADLLVACLVMPLGAVYEVSKEWRLGADLCDMWTSSDVLCCTASILHLVAIALDRYWAVTDIDYAHQRTARRIGYMIIIIWTLSVLVSIAPLLGWKDPEWEARVYQDLQCIVSQDVGYQIFATASSFYVPLLVILFLYWRIFLAARKRIRRRQQGRTIVQLIPKPLVNATQTASGGGMIANVAGGSGGIAAAVVAVIGRPLPTISETTTAFTNVSSANTSPEKGSLGNGIERDRIELDPPTADISMAYPSGNQASCSSSSRPPGASLASKKKAQSSTDSKRERKAAKTLAIITGAFVCCWLPFFIIAILLPTCTSCDISPLVTSVCLWLGYFNSTLNPIIYTIFSPEFRHAFKRILCGRRYSLRRTRNLGVRHMR